MIRNVHYFTRRAARESQAAKRAMTAAAKQRHQDLAQHYAALAEGLKEQAGSQFGEEPKLG